MKYIFFVILIEFYIGSSCQSPNNINKTEMSRKAKEQAIKMANNLINRNADSLVGFLYPKYVEMLGGKKQAIAALETSWLKQDEDSTKIISDSIGNPSNIIYYQGQFQCTIPQQMVIAINNQKASVKSTLVAFSMDKGETWNYMDAVGDGFKKMRTIFPEISEELDIPKQSPPEILK